MFKHKELLFILLTQLKYLFTYLFIENLSPIPPIMNHFLYWDPIGFAHRTMETLSQCTVITCSDGYLHQ